MTKIIDAPIRAEINLSNEHYQHDASRHQAKRDVFGYQESKDFCLELHTHYKDRGFKFKRKI